MKLPAAVLTLLAVLAPSARAGLERSRLGTAWILRSGATEYILSLQGDRLMRFCPTGVDAPRPGDSEFFARINAQDTSEADFRFECIVPTRWKREPGLWIRRNHRTLPISVDTKHIPWGDTGVITRQCSIENHGDGPVSIDSWSSLHWDLPPGDYELTTLQGGWGSERQVVVETVGPDGKSLVLATGRSTARYAAWFSMLERRSGIRYAAQLAWSGNWYLNLRPRDGRLIVDFGMRFDGGGPLVLQPRDRFEFPLVAFTAIKGDLDDAANALHRYQSRYVIPSNPANEPPLVQFNSWYPFPGKPDIARLKKCADIAAKIGAEVFVLDSGWYNHNAWDRHVGDWRPDPVAFPNGTAELARHVHSLGMKFGIWLEIENVGDQSRALREHADWCLRRDGRPVVASHRSQLDFARAEVRAWARAEMDRIIRDNQADWVKLDYNIDVGDAFETPDGSHPGGLLAAHILGYYRFLDDVRKAHPDLVIENCSSGGLRFDLGMLAHTHTTWISDRTLPIPSLSLAYGATLEFVPRVCNHWMVGDRENGAVDLNRPPGWWDFMFKVPMNGQFGISSRVFDWNDALLKTAADNVALYKRIRPVIADADVYHLTPPPARDNPSGWMVLQYVSPDRARSVIMAYRLADSPDTFRFQPRGLDPARKYRIQRDSRPDGDLADPLQISLPAPWRATVIELDAEDN